MTSAAPNEEQDRELYDAAVLLAKEVKDNDKRLREMNRKGELTAEALADEVSDTIMSLLTDMAERMALALQPPEDDEEDDDDDEEGGDVLIGLEPEHVLLISRLLTEYHGAVEVMEKNPSSDEVLAELKKKKAEILSTIELVKSLELDVDEDDDEPPESKTN